MMRSLIIALAIAGVLLCPYECAVRAAASMALSPVNTHVACCEKCRQTQAAEQQQSPKQDHPRQDGRSCLCEGAVLDAASHHDLDGLQFATHAATVIDATQLGDRCTKTSERDEDLRPPRFGGGRQVRVWIHSFLI